MKKYKHRMPFYRMASCDLGQVIPVGLVEVLPGDVFRHSTSVFMRMSPLATPVMHPIDVRVHHFYEPTRALWERAGGTGTFEDFISGGEDGTDTQTVPTVNSTGTVGDVLDYLGVGDTAGVPVSAIPLAMYNDIINNWYLDSDLGTERLWNDLTIARCAWAKDYLTSARPWPQRGSAVSLPLGTTAETTAPGAGGAGGLTVSRDADDQVFVDRSGNTVPLLADLSSATATTVPDVRLAFAMQAYQELMARIGARYPEWLARWGVHGVDGRLQLPEYLGGSEAMAQVSEVLQTATGGTYGVGELYGHGVSALASQPYERRFPEHGYVMTLLSVRPYSMYMDGAPRTFLRQDRDDFFEPMFEGIGEQAVYNNEVYMQAGSAGDDVFGYQGRFDDYRHMMSGVSGEFRSVLDDWHLGRTFASAPALNETFVTCTPSKRIFNEQVNHSLWIRARHSLSALRPVSPRAMTRPL